MNMTCTNRVIKQTMFVFNFIFVITGIIILAVGASVKAKYYPYNTFLDDKYFSLPNMLIATGSLIFFISFLGCYGAMRENWVLLMIFSILLTIIFIFELSVGIAGYVLRDRTSNFLQGKLLENMQYYGKSPPITSMWDIIQEDFQCCGVTNYDDWKNTFNNNSLPISCCQQSSGIIGAFYCNSYVAPTTTPNVSNATLPASTTEEPTTESSKTTQEPTTESSKTTPEVQEPTTNVEEGDLTTEITEITEITETTESLDTFNLNAEESSTYPPSSSQPFVTGCLSAFGSFVKSHAVDIGAVGVALAVIQDELSHYLDIVEEQIAQQVSQKSGAFFHAMTSHDTIMEQMGIACSEVRLLRSKVQQVDKALATDSLRLLGLTTSKANHINLIDKLKLMSTVLQTQPTLQLLLSSSDYVAALELISSTQEVLTKDLAGVTSLRHLPSQLKEMLKLIDKMLSTEFERYAAADLHRPLDANGGVLEPERLISLVAGLLRQNHLQFLETYKQEAVTAAQALLKQLMIEQLADADDELSELTGSGEVALTMDAAHWLKVLKLASEALGKLIERVKAVHEVIKETAASSAGLLPQSQLSLGDINNFLTLEEHRRVEVKLKDLLISVCDYCNERLASLISTQTDKQAITASQITELSSIVENFSELCENVCGRQSAALKAAFKIQAGNYVHKFHSQRKNKLTLLLDAERWKVAEVPPEIQLLIDKLALDSVLKSLPDSPTEEDITTNRYDSKPAPCVKVESQHYYTIGTVLILIRLVSEYCVCAYDLQLLAPVIGRNLAELLRTFNSRSCQLVLGAGALRTAGLKTITSTNLALASRSLQLVLWVIQRIRWHFNTLTGDSLSSFDVVEKDIGHHIQQLETKVLSIMNSLLGDQLNDWDAKPPVPSKQFRNISRHLTKLHEAVSSVLPEGQVNDIYEIIHKNFKTRIRDQLVKMNIQNNGGPQHGVVTAEIIFYLQTMKTLKALSDKNLSDKAMDDIWMR